MATKDTGSNLKGKYILVLEGTKNRHCEWAQPFDSTNMATPNTIVIFDNLAEITAYREANGITDADFCAWL